MQRIYQRTILSGEYKRYINTYLLDEISPIAAQAIGRSILPRIGAWPPQSFGFDLGARRARTWIQLFKSLLIELADSIHGVGDCLEVAECPGSFTSCQQKSLFRISLAERWVAQAWTDKSAKDRNRTKNPKFPYIHHIHTEEPYIIYFYKVM